MSDRDEIKRIAKAIQQAQASVLTTNPDNYPKKMTFAMAEQEADDIGSALRKSEHDGITRSPLMAVVQEAQGNANKHAPRLAFTEHPAPSDNYLGLFKSKRRLLPDEVIKQIRITDHLVAAILRARSNMMSLFGDVRKDRFNIGLEVCVKKEFEKVLTPDQKEKIDARIKRLQHLLLNCGNTEGIETQDRMTLADYLGIQAMNGLSFGRFSTEIIYDRSGTPDENGRYPFHRFRPVDTATIYKAVRKGEYVGNTLREVAMKMLESLTAEKIEIDMRKLKEDEYAWLQVIDGTPRQAFTHEEMLVFNLFPSTDVEHNGYPVSPLDTVVSSVTTHISIDAYKKLYFQNGRASKGMLVIKSDEVDEAILNNLKLQFNAAINSVSNSFRTPIFGVGKEDEVDWVDMVGEGARDADFQFMYDQVARNILSAFSISPDELPGYSHLSRGTNSQTLSESNNEFKLTAARDTGLRPLILKFQTFFNLRLLPLIDAELAKIVEIKFSGIDAQSKEQESTRLQQDMAIHMNADELYQEVDKEEIGEAFGGKVPFNERWQLIADKFLKVSELRGQFLKDPAAWVDPMLRFNRDPFFLQHVQLLMQVNPGAVMAYFAPRPPELSLELLKMELDDLIEDDQHV